MKRLKTDEIKKIELDILKYIHDICTKNGLRYWVCGGTLIGAVRHNGFIPWDDDVDIDMPRPDFEKFKKIADSSRYKMLSPDNEKYFYSFGKLVDISTVLVETNFQNEIEDLGVYVDIFPIDGMPDKIRAARREYMRRKRIAGRIKMFYANGRKNSGNIVLDIARYLRWVKDKKSTNVNKIQKKLLNHELKYDYDKSKLVCSSGGIYGFKEIYPKSYFTSVQVHRFEDIEVNIPSGYDEFLTQMYGDYMKLPPEEERVSNHVFEVYWKDDVK